MRPCIRLGHVAWSVLLFLPLAFVPAQEVKPPSPEFEPAEAGKPLDYRISGPFTHENLSIFLLHGPDRIKLQKYMLLPEALDKKLFVIRETQSVNQLEMENLSPDGEVIILAGDIFKGGQQDRFAQFDMIVPPKSGKIPLPAYCVEHTAARWMSKLTPENSTFAASPGQVFSNSQRLAGRYYKSQGKVWEEVRRGQSQLSLSSGVEVKAKESDSSLALSLKVKEVVAATDKSIKKLQPILDKEEEVIGYAFAINGKIFAADVYGSSALFRKVWPRLLEANALEAFAELQKDKKVEAVTATAVAAFLKSADQAKAKSRTLHKDLREVLSEDERARVLRFETQDQRRKDSFLRLNYLAY